MRPWCMLYLLYNTQLQYNIMSDFLGIMQHVQGANKKYTYMCAEKSCPQAGLEVCTFCWSLTQ